MPAPLTPVLDNYNRTESPLSNGANWVVFRGGVAPTTGETNGTELVLAAAVGIRGATWHTSYAGHQQAYVTINEIGQEWIELWLSETSETHGYSLEYVPGTHKFVLLKNHAATSPATESGALTLAIGDKILLDYVEATGVITAWMEHSATWTEVFKFTDGSKLTGGGAVGFAARCNTKGWKLDNFGGGSVAEVSKPANQTSTQSSAIATVTLTGTNLTTLTAKELPAGLTLTKVSETEWTITGTPTTAKAATVVTLEPLSASTAGENVTFEWTVNSATLPVTTKPANQKYTKAVAISTLTLSATNSPTEFKQTGLPAGLALEASTGKITGTPTAVEGSYSVEVWAKNGTGEGPKVTFTIEITAVVKLTSPGNQTSTQGVAITPFTPTATGASLTWSMTTPPTGVSINAATGEISGTPSVVEAEHATKIEIVSANGGSDKATIKWTVNAAVEGLPTITFTETQSSREGTSVGTIKITTTNTASVSSVNLPPGLTFTRVSNSESTITGTPTTPGLYNGELKVFNAEAKEAKQAFKWTILESLATVNKPANQTTARSEVVSLAVTGTHMSTLTATALPAGLTLTKISLTEWKITGSPTVTKTATTVTLEAQNVNAEGPSTTFSWTITGEAAAVIVKPVNHDDVVGRISIIPVQGTKLYHMRAEGLPNGLAIRKVTPEEWIISGVPTTEGSAIVTLFAGNLESVEPVTEVSLTFTITVKAAQTFPAVYKILGSAPVRITGIKNAHGEQMNVLISTGSPYSTSDPNEAWILENLFYHLVVRE